MGAGASPCWRKALLCRCLNQVFGGGENPDVGSAEIFPDLLPSYNSFIRQMG